MRQRNSTIVRKLRNGERGLRRWMFAVLDRVAPEVSGRMATDLWFTLPPTVAWNATQPSAAGRPFTLTVLGARLRGMRWGDHGRPVVYLVHGWGGSGAQLHAFVDPLVDAGFAVVSYDGLSHGASDPGPSASALELSKALRAVADVHGPAAGIVAHSLGCTVAANAVLEGLSVERLIFLAPMANLGSATERFVHLLGAGERTHMRLIRNIEARVNRSVQEFTLYALVRASHVPVLLIHDEDDRDTAWIETKRLASALPSAELVITKGLGHYRILRDPSVIRHSVDFVTADLPVLENRLVG
jgi:pimeloyl-ACP methyl ester carboxylesterase